MKYGRIVYPVSIVVIVIIFVWWCCWPCWFFPTTTTVMLVRHAEKGTSPPGDPVLTPEGEARAAALAHVAGEAGVTAVFVTNTNRSRRTGQDLADLLELELQVAVGSPQDLANFILSNHRGDTVLVVGHSNTVPDIIEALGGEEMSDLADNEFDRFFVVAVPRCGDTTTLKLQYGEPSP